jgi:hypothetical protein
MRAGVVEALRWKHYRDQRMTQRADPRVVIYAPILTELLQVFATRSTHGITPESVYDHERLYIAYSQGGQGCEPAILPYEFHRLKRAAPRQTPRAYDESAKSDNIFRWAHVQECIMLSQHADLAGRSFVLEEGPEICDSDQVEEDHREVLEGMYAPGCESLDQSRIGRAGRLSTVSGAGRQGTRAGNVRPTCQRDYLSRSSTMDRPSLPGAKDSTEWPD